MKFEQFSSTETNLENKEGQENLHAGQTPERLRKGVEKILNQFLKEKNIEGKEHLAEIPPNRRVVIVSSHFSNLDAPLVIDALGNDMDLQMAVMSTHFNKTDVRNLMLAAAGKESFSPLSYENRNGRAFFDPDDFSDIENVVEKRKQGAMDCCEWYENRSKITSCECRVGLSRRKVKRARSACRHRN